MENRIIDTPTELDDRDLDLVSGGGGVTYNQGNTSQDGSLLAVSALNGNNVLSGVFGGTGGLVNL